MEWNDVYDAERNLTGRVRKRTDHWLPGEYALVVCVWVYNRNGEILLTKRAPEKSFAGTWENSGGMVRAGEDTLTGIVRELREETGIRKEKEDFRLLRSVTEGSMHYDHYAVLADVNLSDVHLQPGETCDVQWAKPEKIREMVESGEICSIIGQQYKIEEPTLLEILEQAKSQ